MKFKNAIPLLVLAAVLLWPAAVRTASQSPASLLVQINAEAYLEAASGMQWNASSAVQTLSIPLKAVLRLNRGTVGVLRVSVMDGGTAASALQVETEAGFVSVSQTPVAIRSYAYSGTYQTPVALRLASPPAGQQQPSILSIRLSSSDGMADWSQTITIPPAAGTPIPLAP